MTYRERILHIIAGELGATDKENAARILDGIRQAGYVCVPRIPTKDMVYAAYYDVHDEDAIGTWSSMIEAAEGQTEGLGTQEREL